MADDEEDTTWTVDMEVSLFHAMRKHKPVGVNRHFQMVIIQNRLNDSVPRKLNSKQIWKHLGTMYDLAALNESEIIPFPNSETDFVLPEPDFKDVKEKIFPRVMKESLSSAVDEQSKETTKDQIKETVKESKESARESPAVKPPKSGAVIDKALDRVADTSKSDDSPKREQRKRTRQTQPSPATDNTTPTSSKRTRRI